MPRLVPPFYLGPYKVVRQLGSGGFATVFRAAVEGDLGFSRDVALKVLQLAHRCSRGNRLEQRSYRSIRGPVNSPPLTPWPASPVSVQVCDRGC